MTDQWKDRIIRGGAIAVMTVAALGCMVWLTGIMAGYPGALRAGGIILAAAACIGAVCLATVNIPSLSRTGRRRCRHRDQQADRGSTPGESLAVRQAGPRKGGEQIWAHDAADQMVGHRPRGPHRLAR